MITQYPNQWNSSLDDNVTANPTVSQVRGTKTSKETELESSRAATLINYNNFVTYKGKKYATLDFVVPNEWISGCQQGYLPLPSGWSIAPRNPDSIYVLGFYLWGADLLVLSDGSQYYTLLWTQPLQAGTPRRWICCSQGATALGTARLGGKFQGIQVGFRVNACNRRILIVNTPRSDVINYMGKQYATLDAWNPTDTQTQGCQTDYLPLPSGWRLAPISMDSVTVIQVIGKFAWGTTLLVLDGGSQYYTRNGGRLAGKSLKWNCCADGRTALGTIKRNGVVFYKVNACNRRVLIIRQ